MDLQEFETIDEVGDISQVTKVRNSNQSQHATAVEEMDLLNKILADLNKNDPSRRQSDASDISVEIRSLIDAGAKEFSPESRGLIDPSSNPEIHGLINSSNIAEIRGLIDSSNIPEIHGLIHSSNNPEICGLLDSSKNPEIYGLIGTEQHMNSVISRSNEVQNEEHSNSILCPKTPNACENLIFNNFQHSVSTVPSLATIADQLPVADVLSLTVDAGMCANVKDIHSADASSHETKMDVSFSLTSKLNEMPCIVSESAYAVKDSPVGFCQAADVRGSISMRVDSVCSETDDIINCSSEEIENHAACSVEVHDPVPMENRENMTDIDLSLVKMEPLDADPGVDFDFGDYLNDPAEEFLVKEEPTMPTPDNTIPSPDFAVKNEGDEDGLWVPITPEVRFRVKANTLYSKEQVTAAIIISQSSLAPVIDMAMFNNVGKTLPKVLCQPLQEMIVETDMLLLCDRFVVERFIENYGINSSGWFSSISKGISSRTARVPISGKGKPAIKIKNPGKNSSIKVIEPEIDDFFEGFDDTPILKVLPNSIVNKRPVHNYKLGKTGDKLNRSSKFKSREVVSSDSSDSEGNGYMLLGTPKKCASKTELGKNVMKKHGKTLIGSRQSEYASAGVNPVSSKPVQEKLSAEKLDKPVQEELSAEKLDKPVQEELSAEKLDKPVQEELSAEKLEIQRLIDMLDCDPSLKQAMQTKDGATVEVSLLSKRIDSPIHLTGGNEKVSDMTIGELDPGDKTSFHIPPTVKSKGSSVPEKKKENFVTLGSVEEASLLATEENVVQEFKKTKTKLGRTVPINVCSALDKEEKVNVAIYETKISNDMILNKYGLKNCSIQLNDILKDKFHRQLVKKCLEKLNSGNSSKLNQVLVSGSSFDASKKDTELKLKTDCLEPKINPEHHERRRSQDITVKKSDTCSLKRKITNLQDLASIKKKRGIDVKGQVVQQKDKLTQPDVTSAFVNRLPNLPSFKIPKKKVPDNSEHSKGKTSSSISLLAKPEDLFSKNKPQSTYKSEKTNKHKELWKKREQEPASKGPIRDMEKQREHRNNFEQNVQMQSRNSDCMDNFQPGFSQATSNAWVSSKRAKQVTPEIAYAITAVLNLPAAQECLAAFGFHEDKSQEIKGVSQTPLNKVVGSEPYMKSMEALPVHDDDVHVGGISPNDSCHSSVINDMTSDTTLPSATETTDGTLDTVFIADQHALENKEKLVSNEADNSTAIRLLPPGVAEMDKRQKAKLYDKYKRTYYEAKKKYYSGDEISNEKKRSRYKIYDFKKKQYYNLKMYLCEEKKMEHLARKCRKDEKNIKEKTDKKVPNELTAEVDEYDPAVAPLLNVPSDSESPQQASTEDQEPYSPSGSPVGSTDLQEDNETFFNIDVRASILDGRVPFIDLDDDGSDDGENSGDSNDLTSLAVSVINRLKSSNAQKVETQLEAPVMNQNSFPLSTFVPPPPPPPTLRCDNLVDAVSSPNHLNSDDSNLDKDEEALLSRFGVDLGSNAEHIITTQTDNSESLSAREEQGMTEILSKLFNSHPSFESNDSQSGRVTKILWPEIGGLNAKENVATHHDQLRESRKLFCEDEILHSINVACKPSELEIVYSNVTSSSGPMRRRHDELQVCYQRTPLSQQLIDEHPTFPLVGLQYVLEVWKSTDVTLDDCYYICTLCSKKMTSTTLVAHIKSVPHRLKFSESHCLELHGKFGSIELKQWTAELVREFTSELLLIEVKLGRHRMAVALEEEMSTILGQLRENLANVRQLNCAQEKKVLPEKVERPSKSSEKLSASSDDVVIIHENPVHKDSRKIISSSNGGNTRSDAKSQRSRSRSRSPKRRRSKSPRMRSRSPKSLHRDGSRRRSRSRSHGKGRWVERGQVIDDKRVSGAELRKLDDFRLAESRLKSRLRLELDVFEKSPETHPHYTKEWQRFWERRSLELKMQRINPDRYDFGPEWTEFWHSRIANLCRTEYERRRWSLLKKFRIKDPDEKEDQGEEVKKGVILPRNQEKPEVVEVVGGIMGGMPPRSASPWEEDENSRCAKNPSPPHQQPKRGMDMSEMEFNVLGTLQMFNEMEDQLGSFGPALATLLDKSVEISKGGGQPIDLFRDPDNLVLVRLAREKLQSQVAAGILGEQMLLRSRMVIERAMYLQVEAEKLMPRDEFLGMDINSVARSTLGMDTVQIAQYIAHSLLQSGTANAAEEDLQRILLAISASHSKLLVEQANESRNRAMEPQPDSGPATMGTPVSADKRTTLFPSTVTAPVGVQPEEVVTEKQAAVEDVKEKGGLPMLQAAYKDDENAAVDMEKLSLEDLQALLTNFRNLDRLQQKALTSYLKKLEASDPKKVMLLRQRMQEANKAATMAKEQTAKEQATIKMNKETAPQLSSDANASNSYFVSKLSQERQSLTEMAASLVKEKEAVPESMDEYPMKFSNKNSEATQPWNRFTESSQKFNSSNVYQSDLRRNEGHEISGVGYHGSPGSAFRSNIAGMANYGGQARRDDMVSNYSQGEFAGSGMGVREGYNDQMGDNSTYSSASENLYRPPFRPQMALRSGPRPIRSAGPYQSGQLRPRGNMRPRGHFQSGW